MKKLCSYAGCRVVVEDGSRCKSHPYPKREYKRKVYKQDKFYFRQSWKRLAASQRKKQPLCEMALSMGTYLGADVADHWFEIEDGCHPFDVDNLVSLSHAFHNEKTQAIADLRRKEDWLGMFNYLVNNAPNEVVKQYVLDNKDEIVKDG